MRDCVIVDKRDDFAASMVEADVTRSGKVGVRAVCDDDAILPTVEHLQRVIAAGADHDDDFDRGVRQSFKTGERVAERVRPVERVDDDRRGRMIQTHDREICPVIATSTRFAG